MQFKMNDQEYKTLREWQEKIKKTYGEYGKFTYSFSPTGIGNNISVYSHLTGKSIDISDYDSW